MIIHRLLTPILTFPLPGGRNIQTSPAWVSVVKSIKTTFAAAFLVAALGLILGCGVLGGRGGAPDPLVIGHLSTSRAYVGPDYYAVSLAATHLNLAGGVDGLPVVVVSINTGRDTEDSVDAVQSLVDDYGAAVMVGPRSSGVSVAVIEAMDGPHRPLFISPSATSPALTTIEDDDFFFRTAVSDVVQGVVLARLAWDEGYGHVAVMHLDDPYGRGLADQFEETFTALGGQVTRAAHEQAVRSTYAPDLAALSEAGAEALIPISHDEAAEVYVREAILGGYFDELLLVDANKTPELLEAIGWELLEGALGTSPGTPAERPERGFFDQGYKNLYGTESHGESFVAESYDAAIVLGLAAAKAGSATDAGAIRNALRSVSGPPGTVVLPGVEGVALALQLIADGEDVNYEGASGDVDFDDNGDVDGYIEIWTVEGGEIKSTGRFETP